MKLKEERIKLAELQTEYRDMEMRMVELRAAMAEKYNQIQRQRDVIDEIYRQCPYTIREGSTYTEPFGFKHS